MCFSNMNFIENDSQTSNGSTTLGSYHGPPLQFNIYLEESRHLVPAGYPAGTGYQVKAVIR